MFTTRPELIGDVGMVASTHWLASATGMAMLERGGNAADAAVAAGFVMQIVEPHLNGPGGEAPILVWSPEQARARVICGQGVAPEAATIDHFESLGLDLVPGTGLLPAVVPGAFAAWLMLLDRYGTMSLREVLEPAIDLAHRGHPLLPTAARAIASVQEFMQQHWRSSVEIWLRGGSAPAAGSRFRNPLLAETYRRILAEAEAAGASRAAQIEAARVAWYQGFVAEAIDGFVREHEVMDSSGRPHAGLLTGQDLAEWSATEEEPASVDYHDTTVFKTGPWGQGPVLLQHLSLLRQAGVESMQPGSADWVHTIIEAGKLAFADREAWYGDPNHTDVPLSDLLAPQYAAERAALIGQNASMDLVPGSPGGRVPRLPDLSAIRIDNPDAAGTGEPTVAHNGVARGDTCHVDAVDANGMMISATPSGGWLQSSPAIPGLGFALGNRGQMFWLQEGLASSLRSRSRPRTTLTPSFATRDGRAWMAFGSPGGEAQDQWQLQFFLNVLHAGHNLQQAIDAPAFHSLHVPSSFYPREPRPGEVCIEDRFDREVLQELRRRGHRLVDSGSWAEGRVSVVAREDGWLKAAANPRGSQGYAAGR